MRLIVISTGSLAALFYVDYKHEYIGRDIFDVWILRISLVKILLFEYDFAAEIGRTPIRKDWSFYFEIRKLHGTAVYLNGVNSVTYLVF